MSKAFRVRFYVVAAAFCGALLAALPALADAGGAECGSPAPAADGKVEQRSSGGADAWIVSTRRAPLTCPTGFDPDRFSYQRRDRASKNWAAAEAAAFFDPAPAGEPIVVFVHGNRAGLAEAINEGLPVLHRLERNCSGRPFRLVIWAWPAERICGGPRQDVLVKAARSDVQSYYLAEWLDRLPPGTPVLLVGYSLGARVIAGALHLAEGGSLAGWKLARGEAKPRPTRVMLVAAALDSEWLLPGNRHGLALQGVDQALITCNCLDPVLRLYPRLRRDDRSSALGFAGPAGSRQLADAGLKFETVRVECQVGREHDWQAYLRSPAVESHLVRYAFPAAESKD